jgi:hypothetical protein
MMREVALKPGLRVLLGVLGAVAVIAGVVVGAVEVRSATRTPPNWPAIFVALICVVIVVGGVRLLQGAWRGRIAVRDPSGGAFRQRR